jgi:hypothetical protein
MICKQSFDVVQQLVSKVNSRTFLVQPYHWSHLISCFGKILSFHKILLEKPWYIITGCLNKKTGFALLHRVKNWLFTYEKLIRKSRISCRNFRKMRSTSLTGMTTTGASPTTCWWHQAQIQVFIYFFLQVWLQLLLNLHMLSWKSVWWTLSNVDGNPEANTEEK